MRAERWPLHPLPYPDEALSSWLRRIAHEYGMDAGLLQVSGLGREPLDPDALDTDPPDDLIEAVARRTGSMVAAVRATTVAGYMPLLIDAGAAEEGLLWSYAKQFTTLRRNACAAGAARKAGFVPWLPRDPGARSLVCPRCLAEDREPYRRIHWRLAWMASCPIHGVLLQRLGDGLSPIAAGLAADRAVLLEEVPAPTELAFVDSPTLQAVTTGLVGLPNGERVHGGVWLRKLRRLIDELMAPTSVGGSPSVEEAWRRLGLERGEGVPTHRKPFELLTDQERVRALTVAGAAVEGLLEGSLAPATKRAPRQDREFLVPVPKALDDQPVRPRSRATRGRHQGLPSPGSLGRAAEDTIKEMQADPACARSVYAMLTLGGRASAAHIARVDEFFRELGIALPPPPRSHPLRGVGAGPPSARRNCPGFAR
jgi:hypothetical protein